jgi:hypothetical protein
MQTGLIFNLSTMQGALGLKNPDIHCDINGIDNTLKFGKHNIELPAGEYALTVKIDPVMGKAIQDQSIRFTVQENAHTYINYKVDMFNKSSIQLDGIKEQKEEEAKEWSGTKKAAGGLGYALGRLFRKRNN